MPNRLKELEDIMNPNWSSNVDDHMKLLDKIPTTTVGGALLWLKHYAELVEHVGPDSVDLVSNGQTIVDKLRESGLVGDAARRNVDPGLDPELYGRDSIARSIEEIEDQELGYPNPQRLDYEIDLYTYQGIRDTAHRSVDERIYREIDPNEYFDHSLARNAKKIVSVQARHARTGEEITVITLDGTFETPEIAKEGQIVVMNPGGEKYLVDEEKFTKQYIETSTPGVFVSRGEQPARQVMILDEDVKFLAPWGAEMNIKRGGALVYNGPGDIYGIQPDEFNSTYSFTDDITDTKPTAPPQPKYTPEPH